MDTVLDALLGPFQYAFMTRALIVAILVGVMCPVVGAYVVVRGLSFMGDALAHSALPGMVVAFMLGISPLLGLIPTALVVALLIGYMSRHAELSEDTAIGILFAGLFALGLVLLTRAEGLPVNLEDILLGQVLGVSVTDIRVTAALALVVMVVLGVLHKELVFANFDPAGATASGLPTSVLDYVLLLLLAIVVVIALPAVGIVLVVAMLVTPAAAAQQLTPHFAGAMAVGALLGAVSSVIGLYLSFHYNLASGPTMALVATGFFVLSVLYRQGVNNRWWLPRQLLGQN